MKHTLKLIWMPICSASKRFGDSERIRQPEEIRKPRNLAMTPIWSSGAEYPRTSMRLYTWLDIVLIYDIECEIEGLRVKSNWRAAPFDFRQLKQNESDRSTLVSVWEKFEHADSLRIIKVGVVVRAFAEFWVPVFCVPTLAFSARRKISLTAQSQKKHH